MHKNLQANKSKNTSIECIFRKSLWKQGIRYRKNYKVVNCRPDIVITKYKIAIFCDGDFWHGYNFNIENFKKNTKFWYNKIKNNQERDLKNTIELRDAGWIVLRFWEHNIRYNLNDCIEVVLANYLKEKNKR